MILPLGTCLMYTVEGRSRPQESRGISEIRRIPATDPSSVNHGIDPHHHPVGQRLPPCSGSGRILPFTVQ